MDAITLELPSIFDISTVLEFHQTVLTSLNDSSTDSSIVIDAGFNERIDTAALQLLLAVTNEISKKNMSFIWQNLPATLKSSAEKLNLTQALQLT